MNAKVAKSAKKTTRNSVFAAFAVFAFYVVLTAAALACAMVWTGSAQAPPASLAIHGGSRIERQLAPDAIHRFALTLAAGEFADVVVNDKDDDVVVTLSDEAAAERLRVTTATASDGSQRVCFVAERPGVHTIGVAAPRGLKQPTTYTLDVNAVRVAGDADRLRLAALAATVEGQRLENSGTGAGNRAAAERYQAAATLWAQTDDRSEASHAWYRAGLLRSGLADYAPAIDALQRASTLRQEAGDPGPTAAALYQLGLAYFRKGDHARALAYYEESLPLRRDAADRIGEALTLNGVGQIHLTRGDAANALPYFLDTIALARSMDAQPTLATGLFSAGMAHRALGNSQAAIDLLTQSLEIRRKGGFASAIAPTLTQLGAEYYSLGDLEKARAMYEEALPLRQKAGDRRGEGYTTMALGRVMMARGDRAGGLQLILQSVDLLHAIGDRSGEAESIFFVGRALQNDDPRRALDWLVRARELYRELGSRRFVARVTFVMGMVSMRLGQTDQALQYYTDALATFRQIQDRAHEAELLLNLGRAERQRNRLEEARAHIEASLRLLESNRVTVDDADLRTTYLADNYSAYQLAIDVEMDLEARNPGRGHAAAALAASERAHARTLVELLERSREKITEGVDAGLRSREHDARARMVRANARVGKLLESSAAPDAVAAAERDADASQGELESILRDLRRLSPQYAALVEPSPLDLAGIRELLGEGDVLLEYALGPERSYVWAVTRETLTVRTLPPRADIEEAARRAHDLLSRGVRRETQLQTRRALEALSTIVLAPVGSALSAVPGARVIVVPDGALQYVPFAALPRPLRSGGSAAEPLVVRHEVVMLPSASTLDVLRRAGESPGRAEHAVAVFADPVLRNDDPRVRGAGARAAGGPLGSAAGAGDDDLRRAASESGVTALDRLPYTRTEADAIAALAPQRATLKAVDFAASRATALAELERYRIVHFATHALINNRQPDRSGIVLSLVDAAGQPVDGFLRLHDVYNLRLNADLVVLSACRTALGREFRGEGLVGLTRGFLYAGVPAVVASLWDVRDRSTSELMTRFYRAMLREGLAPAAALRAAQISMWRDQRWSAPGYWAAFILQGDWKAPAASARK